jgi:hypothetical protein
MSYNAWGYLFIAICFVGFYLAYLYGHKTKLFRWSEYFAIIILPIFCIIYLAWQIDFRILNLFVISALAGFFLEYIIGLTYHKTLNKRLWKYKRLDLNGYTSLLSVPLWGIAGVAFWLFSKMVGL